MQFSTIAADLYSLLRKDVKFEWTEKAQTAFERIIEEICNDVVLAFPDHKQPFHLTCDASNLGMGAVLSQKDGEGNDRPISFISALFKPCETRYSVTEKECLAIVWATRCFRYHLLNSTHKFTIYTGHRCLQWLKNNADTSGRLFRWYQKLSEYKPGKENVVADELSRNFDENDILEASIETVNFFSRIEEEEDEYEPLAVDINQLTADDEEEEEIEGQLLEDAEMIDREIGNVVNSVTDEEVIDKIIKETHTIIGGHRGIHATVNAIKFYFKIPNLQQKVTEFINKCIICQKNKISRCNRKKPMVLTTTSTMANQRVAFDVIGPFKYSNERKLYGLTIQDDLTKFIKFCAIKDCTADSIAKAFVEEWIYNFGIPKELLSDNGANLCGELMTQLARYLGISRVTTSIAHPQSNGAVERCHARLGEIIRATDSELEIDTEWATKLKMASYCFNTTVHQATGYSPHHLMI